MRKVRTSAVAHDYLFVKALLYVLASWTLRQLEACHVPLKLLTEELNKLIEYVGNASDLKFLFRHPIYHHLLRASRIDEPTPRKAAKVTHAKPQQQSSLSYNVPASHDRRVFFTPPMRREGQERKFTSNARPNREIMLVRPNLQTRAMRTASGWVLFVCREVFSLFFVFFSTMHD